MQALLSPASLSLAALIVVIVFSLTSRINVGVLAVALATGVAVLFARWKPDELAALFPSSLFLTLVGVTLLFSAAQANGTLEAIAGRITALSGGHASMLPILFFLFALCLSCVGPGGAAATALIAPLAMASAARAGVPMLLMALAVGNGANAGNLSPVTSMGIVAQASMAKAGLLGHGMAAFAASFLAHTIVAVAAYLLFGGLTLLRKGRDVDAIAAPPLPMSAKHWATLVVLAIWIIGVIFLGLQPGLSGFVAAAFLIALKLADDGPAVKGVPWNVIMMVSGVSVLIGVLDKTGGLDMFTTALTKIMTPATANGALAFVTGIISTYSSTSGVVYPAFLPTVADLAQKLGGGSALEMALSICVGAALVDVSPLSTIGALAIAATPPGATDMRKLFRGMLLWGFAMALVAAVFCQLFIRFFAW